VLRVSDEIQVSASRSAITAPVGGGAGETAVAVRGPSAGLFLEDLNRWLDWLFGDNPQPPAAAPAGAPAAAPADSSRLGPPPAEPQLARQLIDTVFADTSAEATPLGDWPAEEAADEVWLRPAPVEVATDRFWFAAVVVGLTVGAAERRRRRPGR
jgi:hypothetical protein